MRGYGCTNLANQVAAGGKKTEFKTARKDHEFHRTAEAKSRHPSSPPQSNPPLLFAHVTNGPPQGGLFSPLDLSRDNDSNRISRAYKKSLYGLQGSERLSERGSARLCVLCITKFFTAPANSPAAQAKHKSCRCIVLAAFRRAPGGKDGGAHLKVKSAKVRYPCRAYPRSKTTSPV